MARLRGGVLRGLAVLPQPQCRERPGMCWQSEGSHSWEGGVWEPIWCQIIKNLGGCSEELLRPPAFHSERRQTAEGLVTVTLRASHPTVQVLMPPACIAQYVDVQHKDCFAALLEVSGRRFAPRKRLQQASPKSKGARLHNHSCISALRK